MAQFVTTTSLGTLHPVGTADQRSLTKVNSLVKRFVPGASGLIFAEPVHVRDGGTVDWYVEGDGVVIALADLAGSERGQLGEALAGQLAAIRDAVEELRASGDARERTAGEVLRIATLFPGEASVFALRDNGTLTPIVTGWGYQNQDVHAQQAFSVSAFGPMSQARPRPRPPAPPSAAAVVPAASAATAAIAATKEAPPRPVERRPRRGLGWLLPALFGLVATGALAFVLALLLPACGLRTPFGTIVFGIPGDERCGTALAAPPPVVEPPRANDLEREFGALRQDYVRRRFLCAVAAPEPIAPITPAISDEDQRDLQEAEDRIGNRGEAQISLIWETEDDLDLWVQCPGAGEFVRFDNPQACGGFLDLDANAGGGRTLRPAENITFDNGTPGGYLRVLVNPYELRGGRREVPFSVRIRRGDEEYIRRGTVRAGGGAVLVDEFGQ